MSDADNDGSAFDRAMRWQLEVTGSAFAVGFSGALFLLVGSAAWLVSWLGPGTRQLPNPK